jgi:fatty-acyl-CoA synthase
MMSGAPCPVELMKRVLNEMHIGELVIAYGQTETSPVVTMSDAGDSLEIRVNTVGRAMPQTELQVVSPTDGARLPIGMQGEICVRGYAVMKGYDGDPEGTAQVVKPDGWLHTGDLGVMRQDGCLHITGRSRDVIIRGGENISAAEVEAECYACPAIAEVAVFGAPDERLGEVPIAVIHLKNGEAFGEAELRAFLDGRLAKFKIPERIVLSAEPLPKLGTGKIDRRALKAQYAS